MSSIVGAQLAALCTDVLQRTEGGWGGGVVGEESDSLQSYRSIFTRSCYRPTSRPPAFTFSESAEPFEVTRLVKQTTGLFIEVCPFFMWTCVLRGQQVASKTSVSASYIDPKLIRKRPFGKSSDIVSKIIVSDKIHKDETSI